MLCLLVALIWVARAVPMAGTERSDILAARRLQSAAAEPILPQSHACRLLGDPGCGTGLPGWSRIYKIAYVPHNDGNASSATDQSKSSWIFPIVGLVAGIFALLIVAGGVVIALRTWSRISREHDEVHNSSIVNASEASTSRSLEAYHKAELSEKSAVRNVRRSEMEGTIPTETTILKRQQRDAEMVELALTPPRKIYRKPLRVN